MTSNIYLITCCILKYILPYINLNGKQIRNAVPKMISGLYWSTTAAMSAILFLALRQFIVMQVSFLLLFFGTTFDLLLSLIEERLFLTDRALGSEKTTER